MNTLIQKLRILPPHRFRLLNAPSDSIFHIQPLPEGFHVVASDDEFADSVHWFVSNLKELELGYSELFQSVEPGILVCIYFPRRSQSMSDENNWFIFKTEPIRRLSLVSVDKNWSAYLMRKKTEADYVLDKQISGELQASAETVVDRRKLIYPVELEIVFKHMEGAEEQFEQLPFDVRREFVDWIKVGRRDETRQDRAYRTAKAVLAGKRSYKE